MPQAESSAAKTGGTQDRPWYRKLRYTEWTVVVLMVLALIGIATTYYRPQTSYRYWLVMVPVFGIACATIEWSRARQRGQSGLGIVRDQALHWFGVLVAVYLVYLLLGAGLLDNSNAGLVIILTLALATYLAGVHLGWRLHLVGAFLGAIIVVQIFFKAYVWLLVLVGLLMVGVYVYIRMRSDKPGTAAGGGVGTSPARRETPPESSSAS